MTEITIKKAAVHNLKDVSISLKHNQLIVFTGVSGSGKSSLAFDTIYAEGQRRYVESLSNYARRFLGSLPKPQAELIEGLSPTISIEQKTIGKNPRSTVGTITGMYDFMRVVFARIGTAYCPESGEEVTPQTLHAIQESILSLPEGSKCLFLAPYMREKKGEFKELFQELLRKGFLRIRLDGRLIELSEPIDVDKTAAHDIDLVVDRIAIRQSDVHRINEAIASALSLGEGLLIVHDVTTGQDTLYSQYAHSEQSGKSYPPLEPHDFSFNHPAGMCPDCEGLGTTLEFDTDAIIDPEKSIAEDCCCIAGKFNTVRYSNIYTNLARHYDFDVRTPWKNLPKKAQRIFLYGSSKRYFAMRFIHPETKKTWIDYVRWNGVLHEAKRRYLEAKSDSYKQKMQKYMREATCSACKGARIRPYPAATRLHGKTIAELCALSIDEAHLFVSSLTLSSEEEKIAGELLREIEKRAVFLRNVGLHYLTLDRPSPTLSGGEAQRVRLASQIGAGLVGTTYILDEPSIGLHDRDNEKLIQTLIDLKNKGNTVIIVEHDEETIYAADHIVDIGPYAGSQGGEIIAEGSVKTIMQAKRSITGHYLSGKKRLPIPETRRTFDPKACLTITGASHHNLKCITASIPLGLFTAITGVSGCGKSSLISDTLYPALLNTLQRSDRSAGKYSTLTGAEQLDKVIAIDQSPIGRTPRSNPSTYIKLFDHIRELFSKLPEAQAAGFTPGRFSFNVSEGSCMHCKGMGALRIDMDFLEDAYETCPVCEGQRFDPKTLSITYKGRSIHDVLEMSVTEAHAFFHAIPAIRHMLDILLDVGLGYITLGQSSTSLSGGEAQRIKLARELIRPSTGKTLYIFDEPTTGLHFYDVHNLLSILERLTNEGNTIVVIEHNIDLIKSADYLIDLGPEGGDAGGHIIGCGTPEEIATLDTATGRALRKKITANTSKSYAESKPLRTIEVVGAKQNTLKNVTTSLPRGKITVCTGPSGSGKSSFAFETVFAEGTRRYTDTLSPYARQFIKQMPKPKVEDITGLSPAIAIEQKHHSGNPRSTVGTITEIYDFLRLLYARKGVAHCPETGDTIESITPEYVVQTLMRYPEKTKMHILAPIDDDLAACQQRLQKNGYLRIKLGGTYYKLDEEIPYDAKRKNALYVVIDRVMIKEGVEKRLFDAIEQAKAFSDAPFVVDIDGEERLFNLAFAVPSTGKSYPTITPHTFSFNADAGMCPNCHGLGFEYGADLLGNAEIMRLSPIALMDKLWKDEANSAHFELFEPLLEQKGINPDLPLYKQPPSHLKLLLNGTIAYKSITWEGINTAFARIGTAGRGQLKAGILPHLSTKPCVACQGKRLNPLALAVTIQNHSIADFCALPLKEAEKMLHSIDFPPLLEEVRFQLMHRLEFLCAIGLEYLSLDRTAPTLSGGEAQRIHLAKQLGSKLTGCLYVLDEPTIGLHPHNNTRLNQALKKLAALGNTLLLVEHDPLTIAIADRIIDFGPYAGQRGGEIVAQGTYKQLLKHKQSSTAHYLAGTKQIPRPAARRSPKNWVTIANASLHNLRNITVDIPTGIFTVMSGVSGSGKSTLIHDLFVPAVQRALITRPRQERISYKKAQISQLSLFDKVIAVDQNPIGHSSRADVNTFSDIQKPLRSFYSELPEAKLRGLKPKHFSYNHVKGMCTSCWGLGYKKIRLQFMPPVEVRCESCKGYRLNPVSLGVAYKGKNLGVLLELTIDELLDFLPPIPQIDATCRTLQSVGLGYLKLGQGLASLSGGEAQRLRLSKELSKRSTGKTLYVFDEPTIGLHPDDTTKLLRIFHTLVDKGNTVLVIEHNLDILANADHIIDLGPDAGDGGGLVVATGTPEEVCQNAASKTGAYLKRLLAPNAPSLLD